MRFIVTHTGYCLENNGFTLEKPVTADSPEEIEGHFEAAAMLAMNNALDEFQLFGETFLTHNFFKKIPPDKQAQWQRHYQSRNLPLPVLYPDSRGFQRQYVPVKVETLDAWFSRNATLVDAELVD